MEAGFKCQAAAFLNNVVEYDDAGRVTKAHSGAENVVLGVDNRKRLWVFRVVLLCQYGKSEYYVLYEKKIYSFCSNAISKQCLSREALFFFL